MSWVAIDGEHLEALRRDAEELRRAREENAMLRMQVREAERMLADNYKHAALKVLRAALGGES